MLKEGQTFAHFEINRMLGRGGMGEVYLATDNKLGREVALKVLSRDVFGDAEKHKRFQREARTAAQINSPYVMGIYDIGSAGSEESDREVEYIVMEYVKGDSLAEHLKKNSPGLSGVLRLAEKIAVGLSVAHKLNIVHRDIKADNILIDEDLNPRILDFGLAKPIDPPKVEDDSGDTVSQELTMAGKIVGTVSYMSPEQARGEAVDTRSDIFAFGTLLYRMVTGEFPFTGESQVSTLAKILEGRHESPRARNSEIPPELERIIDKCLQKDPNDRYQNTQDLVVDLRSLRRQFDSGVSDTVSTVTAAARPTGARSSGKMIGIIAAAVVVVVVVAVYYLLGLDQSSGTLPRAGLQAGTNALAVVGFENKTGDSDLSWLETGLPEILITDLAQSDAISLISQKRLEDHLNRHREGREGTPGYEEYLECASSLGAVNILSGSYYKLGDKIRIDARLEEVATGQIVLAEKVVGEDPFVLVDSLTDKIAASLNIMESFEGATDAASFASASPNAYRLYLEGMSLFGAELYYDARDKFEAALAIDSSFALPYLRIGMSHIFQGRLNKGVPYLQLATQHAQNLPVKEKSLLDIYMDTWVNQQFDAATTKLEAFVRSYPEDPEGRTFYGIFLQQIVRDTVSAFAQYDSALMLDPSFQLTISQYASHYINQEAWDQAQVYIDSIMALHPHSPTPYRLQAALHSSRQNPQKAIDVYKQMLELFPENPETLEDIATAYIRMRDFASARTYLERYRDSFSKNPLRMYNYHNAMANIADWNGQFRERMKHERGTLEVARNLSDSARIQGALADISRTFFLLDNRDSAMYYARRADEYAIGFNRLDFPMRAVTMDPGVADELRPQFKEAIDLFKSRVPVELWVMADYLTNVFEAQAVSDTAALIESFSNLVAQQNFNSTQDQRKLAELLIKTGKFEAALEALDNIYGDGLKQVSSGYGYVMTHYLLGRANEGLGNKKEATEHYREVMKYWADADYEVEAVSESRSRLAKLTG